MSQWTISKRPKALDELYGLDNIKRYFYERARTDDWPKAVLLRGQFGNGKTTTAKIIAAMMVAQNVDRKGNPMWDDPSTLAILEERYDRDVLLIDGGQSGKSDVVDTIKEFIATPPMYDKRKVIIIEEVQELSTAAKNSLLKTLEHPRPGIHFILLSMEYGGASGFASRCVPFNFKKLSTKELMFYLKHVMEQEGLWDDESIPEEFKFQGIGTIAQTSGGSLRQALQVLELCVTGKYFTAQEIEDNLGFMSEETIINLLMKLLDADDSFWNGIMKYDPYEFFAIAAKIVADAQMYSLSGFLADEGNQYFARNTKMVGSHPGLPKLLETFAELAPLSKPFLRKSEMLMHFGFLFEKMKEAKTEPKGVNGARQAVPTRAIPTRQVNK